MLLLHIYIADNNKMYSYLHSQCPILTNFKFSGHCFIEVPDIKSHRNSSNKNRVDIIGQTDGQDEASRRFFAILRTLLKTWKVIYPAKCNVWNS